MAFYPASIWSPIPLAHTRGDTLLTTDYNNPTSEIVAIETALLNGFTHSLKAISAATQNLGTSGISWNHIFSGGNFYNTFLIPGQPTLSPLTTGGTLPAGTWFVQITALDGLGGETTAGLIQSTITTGSSGSIAATWASLYGVPVYKVYFGSTINTNTYFTVTAPASSIYVSGTQSYTITTSSGTSGSPPSINNAYYALTTNSGISRFAGTEIIGAGVNSTLYTVISGSNSVLESIQSLGVPYLELGTLAPDAAGNSIGVLTYSVNVQTSATDKRVAALIGFTDGINANNRGGALAIFTKSDGGTGIITERLRIDRAGHIIGSGTIVTAASGSNAGSGAPVPVVQTNSTDVKGQITFGTGTGPTSGAQVVVTFVTTYSDFLTTAPFITITPINSTSATLNMYVSASSVTSFTISCNTAPASSQSNSTYGFNYHCIQ
jgi:hypothetical protein